MTSSIELQQEKIQKEKKMNEERKDRFSAIKTNQEEDIKIVTDNVIKITMERNMFGVLDKTFEKSLILLLWRIQNVLHMNLYLFKG